MEGSIIFVTSLEYQWIHIVVEKIDYFLFVFFKTIGPHIRLFVSNSSEQKNNSKTLLNV